MQMDRIGKYSIIDSKRLFVPSGNTEDISINTEYEGDAIYFILQFENDGKIEGSSIRLVGASGHATIKFINWNNHYMNATQSALVIGRSDKNEPISIMAAAWAVGKAKIVEIQIMVERDDDGKI